MRSKLPLLLPLFAEVIKIVACGLHSRLHVCPESFILAWHLTPPYTEVINDTAGGILLETFKKGIRSCCATGDDNQLTPFITFEHEIEELMMNESFANSLQFMLPVQRSTKSRSYMGHPYVPTIFSPGFALFVKPRGESFEILLRALKPVLPIFIISVFAVPIAGVLFWMIESMTIAWGGGRPQRFDSGIQDGIWWAFITMTTIGYGDIIAKTNPGRIFSVLWILAGIVLSGVVVSTIASVLIDALSPKVVQLMNQNVAVLHDSEESTFAFKKQGIAHEFENITEISKALETNAVDIALVDVLVAARHSNQLKKFVLDRIIEQETNTGVVFLPNGLKFSSCFHQYVLNEQREIIDNVSKIVKGSSYRSYRPVTPSSIIDPTVPAVQYTLAAILIITVVLYICALLNKCLAAWMAPSNKEHAGAVQEGRLMKEYKETYLRNLDDFLKGLMRKCEDEIERFKRSKDMWSTFEEQDKDEEIYGWKKKL